MDLRLEANKLQAEHAIEVRLVRFLVKSWKKIAHL